MQKLHHSRNRIESSPVLLVFGSGFGALAVRKKDVLSSTPGSKKAEPCVCLIDGAPILKGLDVTQLPNTVDMQPEEALKIFDDLVAKVAEENEAADMATLEACWKNNKLLDANDAAERLMKSNNVERKVLAKRTLTMVMLARAI